MPSCSNTVPLVQWSRAKVLKVVWPGAYCEILLFPLEGKIPGCLLRFSSLVYTSVNPFLLSVALLKWSAFFLFPFKIFSVLDLCVVLLEILFCTTFLLSMLSCFSHVWLFVTPWTVACQAPLSMGFSRQEYWTGLSCPLPGHLPDFGRGWNFSCPSTLLTLCKPYLVGKFYTLR